MSAIGIDFYLICAGPTLKRLDVDHRYIFGRAEEADVVISDTLSSRQHCALAWDKTGEWKVEDLGSRNGTYLNGHRISQPTAISDRGVLQIGGQQFVLRLLPPGSDTASLFATGTLSTQNTFELELREVAAQLNTSTFKGDLLDQGLKQMLRFFALTNKSGRLILDDATDKQIWFVKGTPRHACSGALLGLPALKQLASDPGKTFSFHEGEAPEEETIVGEGRDILVQLYGTDDVSGGIDAGDLARAERVQKHMLQHIPTVAGYDLAIFYKGVSGVSGDMYDVGHMADGSLLVVLGDVAGHGIQAALVVAGLVKTLRHLRAESRDLLELLVRLNDEVRTDLLPGQFMTMFIGRLRPASGELTIALLGHHQALHISAEHPEVVDEVGKTGMALGLVASDVFKRAIKLVDIELKPGNMLLQCTDGLLEAMDAKDTEYGDERWHESAAKHAQKEVMQDMVDAIADDVVRFAATINDDLTILALRRKIAVPESTQDPAIVPAKRKTSESTEMISRSHLNPLLATEPIHASGVPTVAAAISEAQKHAVDVAKAEKVDKAEKAEKAEKVEKVEKAEVVKGKPSSRAATVAAMTNGELGSTETAYPAAPPAKPAVVATTAKALAKNIPSKSASEELILPGFSDEFRRPDQPISAMIAAALPASASQVKTSTTAVVAPTQATAKTATSSKPSAPHPPAPPASPSSSASALLEGLRKRRSNQGSSETRLGPAPEMDRQTQPLVRKSGGSPADERPLPAPGANVASPATIAVTPPAGSQALSPDQDPLIGQVLGQVQLTCCVGEGQMARVYRGRHVVLEHDVAVKVMRLNNAATDEHRRKRFMREARLASKISHQHVVQVIDAGLTPDGNTYLVMPLIEGGDLGQRVRNGGRIPQAEFLTLAIAIAKGLAAIHQAGAVHRDLKPANILLDMNGDPKIADFGMAQVVEDNALTKLTKAGFILGTPSYMAPECLNSGEQIDSKADIYSLGVTMYHLLAGRLPCEGATAYEVMQAHSRGDYLPLISAVPQVNPRLAEVVHSCMDRDPNARPKADELVKMLEAMNASAPSDAPGGSMGAQQVEVAAWARRIKQGRRAQGSGLGLLMLVAAVVLLALLIILCIHLM